MTLLPEPVGAAETFSGAPGRAGVLGAHLERAEVGGKSCSNRWTDVPFDMGQHRCFVPFKEGRLVSLSGSPRAAPEDGSPERLGGMRDESGGTPPQPLGPAVLRSQRLDVAVTKPLFV